MEDDIKSITSCTEGKSLALVMDFLKENNDEFITNIKYRQPHLDLPLIHTDPSLMPDIHQWFENFNIFTTSLIDMRFSVEQKNAFSLIRKITRYQDYLKRDGSIISAIRDSNSCIVSDPRDVAELLIGSLKDHEVEVLSSVRYVAPPTKPQSLPPLKIEELRYIVTKLNRSKALPNVTIPDTIITERKDDAILKSLNQLWDIDFLMKHPEIFDMKVIPLNKVHPRLPNPKQMRPIFATSAVFKIMELRFNHKLTTIYQSLPELARFQVGFLPGLSTQINIVRMAEAIRNLYNDPINLTKPKVHKSSAALIYIDYSQAYNSILLYKTFDKML